MEREGERADGGQFLELVAALLSVTCATFVGFADDVFDVKGRYRIALSLARQRGTVRERPSSVF